MKKILYQRSSKRLSIALFVVLTPLMSLKGGGQSNDSEMSQQEKIILIRGNEIEREKIDKINDTIRFIDAWQRYKDSINYLRSKSDTTIKK
jgi:hypothetical protein